MLSPDGDYLNGVPSAVVVDPVPMIPVRQSSTLTGVGREMAVAVAVLATLAIGSRQAAAQAASPELTSPPMQFFVPQQPPAPGQTNIIDEIKGGVLAHDVGFLGHHVETGTDVNIEMLFTSPDLLSAIGSPRPDIGADINTAGNTSDGYVGLTWGIDLVKNLFKLGDAVFLNGSLGGAYQDGYEGTQSTRRPAGRKLLGSPVLFRESAELGYQVTPTISVSALLDHISNANLAPRNAGITSAGLRIGYKF
ncbi:MAG TPA: acyloxyacyl hydrolase [Stellaceae bacterium]|nr:acyloxyacyl hydrolase [Stellaceae bacterium]